jgi:tetratricopeptide (TPR) repeat protein
MVGTFDAEHRSAVEASATALKALLLTIEEKVANQTSGRDGGPPSRDCNRVQWVDATDPPAIPFHSLLSQRRQGVVDHPDDAERRADLGEAMFRLGMHGAAAAEFEKAASLDPSAFRYFGRLARCYLPLDRPDDALQVCERWNEILPNSADLHFVRGLALRKLSRCEEGRAEILRAISLSSRAFEAVEVLMLPLASLKDGAKLLALCDELPEAYANCTIVRGFRAIALSQVGRVDEARAIMDPENQVAQVEFKPPPGFCGVEGFNALLAEEILANPDLQHMSQYGFRRTERLNVLGARAFPVLAAFLRSAMEGYLAEFPRRGLDKIMPDAPKRARLNTAGNVVSGAELHRSHLHKFAYVSGVYHVSVPYDIPQADGRPGALVVGSCNQLAEDYAPCWTTREFEPAPGVATIFPSHLFHSVTPTYSSAPRIAVPFDLCAVDDCDPGT